VAMVIYTLVHVAPEPHFQRRKRTTRLLIDLEWGIHYRKLKSNFVRLVPWPREDTKSQSAGSRPGRHFGL
jgi:hypothetical protein